MIPLYLAYSSDTVARTETVSVGTSSTVISNQKARKMFYILNTSTSGQVITIRLGEGTATANVGINIEAGVSYSEYSDTGYVCFQGKINAISSAANGSVCITER